MIHLLYRHLSAVCYELIPSSVNTADGDRRFQCIAAIQEKGNEGNVIQVIGQKEKNTIIKKKVQREI